jgi:hypothetical protein
MGRDTLELEHDYYLKVAELYDTVDLTFPMPSSNTQRIGAIAESRFITECLERNFEPHLPTTPMPWDFIVTCPAGTLKVQIKASSRKSSVNTYCINSGTGCKSKDTMCETIDVVGCYIIPEQTWWMIPREEIKGVTLKLNILPDSKSKHKKYQENWSIFYE